MKIVVNVKGLEKAEKDLRAISARFPRVIRRELQAFGKRGSARMKEMIVQAELVLEPKKRDDGKPPLYHIGTYVNGYVAEFSPAGDLVIYSKGQNLNWSNEELGELLEWGTKTMPARPHIRPLLLWVERQLPNLGERIVIGVLGGD